LKHLITGFDGYLQVNRRLPAAGRLGPPNPDDWIYWQADSQVSESQIARHMTNFGGSLLRCPADTEFRHRSYPYSYSMNAAAENLPMQALQDPKSVALLFEEQTPNDGACALGSPADVLANRHAGRSMAGFLDGHVERVTKRGR